MEAVATFDGEGLLAQPLVGGGAPEVDADPPAFGQLVGRLPGGDLRRAGEQQGRRNRLVGGVGPLVEAPDDVRRGDVVGPAGHLVGLVVERHVVEDILVPVRVVASVHALESLVDDGSQLVGEGGVERLAGGHGRRQQEAVAVLVLEPLAGQGRATGRGAQHEAPCP